MDAALLLLRLVLVGVFGVAGVTKLADLAGSRTAMRSFGLPEPLVAPAGIALPLAELAFAVLLLPRATAWWGALGGLVLLLAFIAGIGYNLWKGRTPDCHCFGQIYSEPIGRSTVIRNGVLALLAAVLVAQGSNRQGYSLFAWMNDLSAVQGMLLAVQLLMLGAILFGGWLLFHLLQQNGRLLLRIEALETGGMAQPGMLDKGRPEKPAAGLPIGSEAPSFDLAGLDGETVTLDVLLDAGKPIVLLFTDPGCGPCNTLMPEIGRWQQEFADISTIAIVSRGAREANLVKATEHGLTRVLVQRAHEVATAYHSLPTPSAVLIRPDGTIGSGSVLGPEAIRSLIAEVTSQPVPNRPGKANGQAVLPVRPVSRIGQRAPGIALPDLDGKQVSLGDFASQQRLVLFWNPGCGFCARMLNDLRAWEVNPPPEAPRLLVVSTGTVEANRALGLRATVLLDQGFATGRAFGASGTPSAVLIDADGKIASDVATGAPAVLTLAGANAASAA